MKYRIVSRNRKPDGTSSEYSWYYVQRNFFGFWIDCFKNPFVEEDSCDVDLEVVERWVNAQISN